MPWYKRLFLWLQKNWKWFFGALAVLGSILLLYFYKDDLTELMIQKKKVSIAKHKKDLTLLKHKREYIKGKIDSTEEQIKEVDDNIDNIYQKINEDREEISSLVTNKKLDKFDDLGY